MKSQPKISRAAVAAVVEATLGLGARKATKYIAPNCVVRATRQFKPDRRNKRANVVLTIGAPNYAERKFIKTAQKAGERFPVRKVQLTWYK